jgi:proline iminopeptidase
MDAIESRIPVGTAWLYCREIGRGEPIIVLHGGPDFDHSYLVPDLDRLADAFHLIYYDQRGRGSSADNVRPEDVSLASEAADVDSVRRHFRLDAPALLGHSWGAVLALEYALRHPRRVSRLILMNPAPTFPSDRDLLRQAYFEKLGADRDRQSDIVNSSAYQAGDPAAVAARYRIHFKPAVRSLEDYERLMVVMKAAFERQGRDGIVKARAIEDRLMEAWEASPDDLRQRLAALRIPTLVIAGDSDFIPIAVADNIVQAMPDARLVTIPDCGHFAYLECADEVRAAMEDFFQLHQKG